MEASHPRQETEEQRRYWRGKLRAWTEEKLKKKGQVFPTPGLVDSVDAGLRFPDGSIGHMQRHQGRRQEGVTLDTVIINLYHTQDTTGPMTQYTSKAPGEFTRADINPQDSGSQSMEEVMSLPVEQRVESLLVGSILAATRQRRDQQEGVDGYPITAEEAKGVLEKLKTAQVVNFQR